MGWGAAANDTPCDLARRTCRAVRTIERPLFLSLANGLGALAIRSDRASAPVSSLAPSLRSAFTARPRNATVFRDFGPADFSSIPPSWNTAAMELIWIEDESPRLQDVLKLHRRFAAVLGFMPTQGFTARLASGTLVIAIVDDTTAGYALYDLPRNEIALRHLCVDHPFQGQGIASALVDGIADKHSDRTGIRVRCRRDWSASAVWPQLGFEPLSDAPGRSAEGHLLTVWWRDFGHPTLFSHPHETQPATTVALDTNIVIDLLTMREGSAESQQLLSDWVADYVQLAITPDVSVELNNHPDDSIRRSTLSGITHFRKIDCTQDTWREAREALAKSLEGRTLTRNDKGDISHIARAHAAGASYFLTSDHDLLRRLADLAQQHLGISVMSPGAFLQKCWQDTGNAYSPATIEDTEFLLASAAGIRPSDIAEHFLNNAQGERRRTFEKRLRRLLSEPDRCEVRVVRDDRDHAVALFARSAERGRYTVDLVRVSGAASATVARQVAYLQRRDGVRAGVRLVEVVDPFLQPQVRDALIDESFSRAGDLWYSVLLDAAGTREEIASELSALEIADRPEIENAVSALRSTSAASIVDEIEVKYWPAKIYGSTLPNFIVPIKPAFAGRLFDSRLSSQTLFARPPTLGLSREHVYYRAPRPNVLVAPARIIWYVSAPRRRGGGEVRACSRLTEVVTGHPNTLFRRYEHLGVYRLLDVQAAARHDRAMALRFAQTELLRPVPLRRLRRVVAAYGGKLQLQSPCRVDERVFEQVYEPEWEDHGR